MGLHPLGSQEHPPYQDRPGKQERVNESPVKASLDTKALSTDKKKKKKTLTKETDSHHFEATISREEI